MLLKPALVMTCLLWLLPTETARAQSTQPADTPQPTDAPIELRPATTLRDAASIAAALEALRAEMLALSPTTRPATSQPTTRPDADLQSRLDGWRLELWKALTELEKQLGELLRLTQALDEPATDKDVSKLTQQIGEWKAEAERLPGQPIPDEITEQMVSEAAKKSEETQKLLDELTATLAQQEALLKEGFKAQREKFKADLARATTAREALAASYEVDLKEADSDAQREIVMARRRTAAARATALEAARLAIDPKERTTQKEHERNRLRGDALRPLVAAQRQRLTLLTEEKSRSRAEKLRRMLEAPNISETQKAFIRLQLLCEEHTGRLQQEATANILDRYTEAELTELATEFKRDTQYWEQFAESISRRSAAEVLAAHAQANREEDAARRLLKHVLDLIDQTITEQRTIEDMERAALDAFDSQAAAFRSLTTGSTDENTIKLREEIGQLRFELRKVHEDLLENEQLVLGRLSKALDVARKRMQLCEQVVSRMYWSHLITRGSHYFDMRRYEPLSDELDAVEGGLPRETATRAWISAQSQSRTMQRGDWIVVALSLIANVLIALWLMRRLVALRTDFATPPLPPPPTDVAPLPADSTEPEALSFVQRLAPRLAKALGRAIPVLLPATLLSTLILTLGLTGLPAQITQTIAGIWLGLILAKVALDVAFSATKSRYRVIPCSSVVARHYMRWGHVLLALAVIFLVPSRLLSAAQILPTTTALLNEWFKFAATIAFFCFLVRREIVLSVWPRNLRGRFAGMLTTMHAAYPLLVLIVLGLGFCRLVGLTALADYVSISLLSTFLLILAASVLYQVFREVLIRVAARVKLARITYAASADAPSKSTSGAASAPDAADVSPTLPTEQLPSSLRLPLSIAKWMLGIAALITALNIWGIRPFEIKRILDFGIWNHNGQDVTLWRIGSAMIAVFAAVVISRGMRQTLRTRFYPGHPGIDVGAQAAIDTLLHYVIIFLGIYVSLSTLRLDLGALAVLFGGLGLGIGLGLQSLVVNFVSGVMILFERHIKVGDIVMLQDKQGEVVSINMRSTTLRTPDGLYMIVPNGEFINQKVENWTLKRAPIRGILNIGVGYSADPKAVRQILLEIAEAESRVLLDPQPEVHFGGFGDNSLNFSLAAWYRTTADRWNGMIDMRYAIMKRFADADIQIPFPQRDLNIKNAVLDVRIRPLEGDAAPPPPNPTA